MKAGKPERGKRAKGGRSDDAAYRRELDRRKRESTLQLLFRASRLVDEAALARVAARPGRPALRRSHTSLFPHIALEGTRITDLAAKLGVTKQAVSQLVDDLEAAGVVERVPDPDDARAKRVVFTARGRAGLLDGLEVLAAFEAELAERIGEDRMEALHDALVALLGVVEGGGPEDG
ncbi:MAG: MarR family winged helix-turn-helix transcriptional regulator [Polyangiales bacterium]